MEFIGRHSPGKPLGVSFSVTVPFLCHSVPALDLQPPVPRPLLFLSPDALRSGSPPPDGLGLPQSQLYPRSRHFLWSLFVWCIRMYLRGHSWNETKIIRKTDLSLFIMPSYLSWGQLSCNKHVRLDCQGPSKFCWLRIQRPETLNYMPWSTCWLLQTLDAIWIELQK